MHASISIPLKGQNALIASTLAAHNKDDQQDEASESDTSRDSISSQVKLLAQALDRGTCKLIRLLPAFDKHRAWANDGQRSCVLWLNTYCGMSLSAAHDRCRVAYALENLPIITRLFMLGELSWSKVRALTRVATPENEQELAAQAQLMSASAIEKTALDSAGKLPEKVVTVENGQGRPFTLTAKQFRFRVRRANGDFV